MPIYEYQCESCHNCFEKLVFAGDKDAVACPECDSENTKKLVSCVSFMGGSSKGLCSTDSSSGFS